MGEAADAAVRRSPSAAAWPARASPAEIGRRTVNVAPRPTPLLAACTVPRAAQRAAERWQAGDRVRRDVGDVPLAVEIQRRLDGDLVAQRAVAMQGLLVVRHPITESMRTRRNARMPHVLRLVALCRAKGLKVATVRGIARTLRTVLTQAVEDELLPAGPALLPGRFSEQLMTLNEKSNHSPATR